MSTDPDAAINTTDRPIVQPAEADGYVEIVWPDRSETTVLSESVAMSMFTDCMRIITETPIEDIPER